MTVPFERHVLTALKIITFILLIVLQQSKITSRPLSTVVTDWAQYNHIEPQGTGTYSFGYDIEDPESSNVQFRNEERHANGTVTGSYGYLEPDGNIHVVHYVADDGGYRATIENSVRGGMLKPILVLEDTSYAAYGYSPQMIAALQSQRVFKKQKLQEQRSRPYDRQSEEQKLPFVTSTTKPTFHQSSAH